MTNTVNRAYPKPEPDNFVSSDVTLLIQSFDMIDADIFGLLNAVSLRALAIHSHAISDILGLVDALNSKAATIHNHTLAGLLDTAGLDEAANGYVLRKVAGTWQGVPASSLSSAHQHPIGDITGLAAVLNAKLDWTMLANATAKGVPADADTMPLSDSADGFSLKRVSFANFKAALRSAFDGVYQAAGSYAAAIHSHSIAQITNLQGVLDGKAERTAVALTKSYTSEPQSITAAGQISLAHGMGAVPVVVQCELVCLTANNGYAVNDRVLINPSIGATDSASERGISVVVDNTSIVVRFSSGANSIALLRKDTGAPFSITNAQFAFVARAFA